jgi:alanine racemase
LACVFFIVVFSNYFVDVRTEYSIAKIEQMCGGKLYPRFDADASISYLMIDSRRLRHAPDALFFAIKGKRQDGHNFIPDLIKNGVRNFVVMDETVIAKYPNTNFILVKDTIAALQKMAIAHRKQYDIPVIGITGSNGKTIVKEWLYQLLSEDYHIVRNPKSFNSQIGVPISVWQMNAEHTLGIFEAGISEPDEMLKLEKVIQPTIGLFTNIGEAHSEGFLNLKHKTKEKLRLFAGVDTLVYCKDHGDINQAISEINSFSAKLEDDHKINLFSWSAHTEANLRVISILQQRNKCFLSFSFQNEEFDVEIPFADKASIENAVHCISIMLILEVPIPIIQTRLKNLTGVEMRLEMKEAINNCTLINDAYNSDIESIRIALDFLSQQHQHAKRTVILSDVHQSGRNDPDLYQLVAGLLKEQKVDRFIGVGKNIFRQKKYFEDAGLKEVHLFNNTDELLQAVSSDWFRNETVLLKGARLFEFERIEKMLEQKSHRTVLEINLDSLVHNLKAFQSLLKPTTKTMAMVKAFSYGSGSYEIASSLQFNNVDYLAVAYADEGVELRKNGISLPIMVMNPEEAAFDAIVNFNLEPEIYSISLLKSFITAVKEANMGEVKIHLELETGMNRLGFDEADLAEAIEIIKENQTIKIASVFSHLVASEDKREDKYTATQIEKFELLSSKIIGAFDYPILKHILNTSGILRHTNAQYDMVRLGIGLYGIGNFPNSDYKLIPVSTLKTTISQIKHVPKGQSIGYGRAGKADMPTTIATVGIGYADGLPRSLSQGKGKILIKGNLYPIIGNICMDMTMVDISGGEGIKEGDEVIVFGSEPSVTEVAEWAGTISYEFLTGISGRVRRLYLQE